MSSWDGELSVDDRRLSVRPSVCALPDPKSRTEGKLAGRKVHDTDDP